ncbi:Fis family transcriptional regulator [Exiguobacterium sp. SH4S7]|uniref:RNA polymerase factor sigma-54 n=1 Tax=Exiguobacterium sp. SH4S7 TaxID=2510958 RepID=UPI0010401FA1|nr:Fis family transcriptional regulator [Exiguobacterium sp. SH4S7]TCI39327.1 Fis family transcriptional regulator [Exiguobacterium sp. SH4S7]
MQRQEQRQLQKLQLTQDMVRRLPVLEADRVALEWQLARLAKRNTHVTTGGTVEWIADAAGGFEARLFEQIDEGSGTEAQKQLQKQLVMTLDHRGLLPETDAVLAKRFGVEMADVDLARRALLFLEPTGIGATSEHDCQYRHAIEHDDPHVLDVFEAFDAKVEHIADKLGMTTEEYERISRIVATLPRTPILYEETEHILPELEVVVQDGELITTWFSPMIALDVGSDREAKWWQETLAMRAETLRSVWAVIERRQADWLRGQLVLHPLTRKEVATEIGKHESTVGRAIQGKYAKTAGGVMEWRHFFVRATYHGQAPFMIKRALAELIQQETAPLSDQALTEELARIGYTVTRRTVANYREALGFGNSRERERQLWKGET